MYINIHPKIQHLSESEIDELITKYYKRKQTVTSLFNEYEINWSVRRATKLFPPKIIEGKLCQNCGSEIAAYRGVKPLTIEHRGFCIACGHREGKVFCNCKYCLLKQEKERIEHHQRWKAANNEMKERYDLYPVDHLNSVKECNYESLPFLSKVILGGLIRFGLDCEGDYIKAYECSNGKLSPTIQLDMIIYKQLYDSNAIAIREDSMNNDFYYYSDDHIPGYPDAFLLFKANYKINTCIRNIDDSYDFELSLTNENVEKEVLLDLGLWIATAEVEECFQCYSSSKNYNFKTSEKSKKSSGIC